jgi:hypothetical protein
MEAYTQQEDRKTEVNIEGKDFTCQGMVHLPGIRLSDVMNESTRFLIVVDAVMFRDSDSGARQRTEYKTLFVNKDEIKYVVPLNETKVFRLESRL